MTGLRSFVTVVAAAALSGCATAWTLTEDDYRSKIYSGTRAHIEVRCAHGACVDMPFSLAADNLLLPITIPWTLANFLVHRWLGRRIAPSGNVDLTPI